MPSLFSSSAQGTLLVSGGSASGSKTVPVQVSSFARDNVDALVWVLWTGAVSTSGATFGVTFGGTDMTQAGAVTWDSAKSKFMAFKLENVPRGAQNAVVSFSSMPTELVTRNLMVFVEVFSGVDQIGDAVTAGGTNTTVNAVTVGSVKPAYRVATGHAIGIFGSLSNYTQTQRGSVGMFLGGQMIVGDAPGAASVVGTATNGATTTNWGAIGIPMTPSVVELTASVRGEGTLRADMAALRTAEPYHRREHFVTLPDVQEQVIVSDSAVRSPAGILMPVWVKDVDDVLDYSLHWDALMADDDEIAAVEHTVSGSLRKFSESYAGNMTQVWLSGSTNTVTHPVRVRVTTLKGRRFDFTFYIAGVQN